MARIGVKITLAKCLELPRFMRSNDSVRPIMTIIKSKCLLSYLFSKEVCIVVKGRLQLLIKMSWYPIKWPIYMIHRTKKNEIIHTYNDCTVHKTPYNRITITMPSFGVSIFTTHTDHMGSDKIMALLSKHLNEIRNANNYELPYLVFRIYEKIKDKI